MAHHGTAWVIRRDSWARMKSLIELALTRMAPDGSTTIAFTGPELRAVGS